MMDTSCTMLDLGDFTCRICLVNYDEVETNSLDTEVEHGEESLLLRDVYFLLLRATKIQTVINTSSQPTRLCSECTNKLLSAYEFTCTIEKSEKILQQYLLLIPQTQPSRRTQLVSSDAQDFVDMPIIKTEIVSDDHAAEVANDNDLEMLDTEFLFDYNSDHESAVGAVEQTILPASECIGDAATIVKEEILCDIVSASPMQLNAETDTNINERKPLIRKSNTATWPRFAIGSRLGTYETSRWHKCDICQRAFAKAETLDKHVKAVHTLVSPERIAALAPKPTLEQPLQCCHCPRTFARKFALRRHMLAMHHDLVEPDDAIDAKKKTNRCKRGLCPHCGRSFSLASLVIHIRRHTGENPYKCDSCEKGFPRRQDLVIHKRQHTGERPHVCTICGKSFIRPNKLSRHVRIHTGHRPYKCSECDKSFAQSNDLRIHMRRHTGEKPYKCNVCGEGFICGTALKTHRKLSLHEPSVNDPVDPYAKCRVNTRNNKQVTS